MLVDEFEMCPAILFLEKMYFTSYGKNMPDVKYFRAFHDQDAFPTGRIPDQDGRAIWLEDI